MDTLTGKILGTIYITVCTTEDGHKFFHIDSDSEDVDCIIDVISEILKMY